MEDTIINVISNVGFPIAVSVALFYQMTKTNDTYIKMLRDFQEVINNNTKSIELFNVTVQRLEREMGYKGTDSNEIKRPKD